MKSNLLMNFKLDKANKKVFVEREFDAKLELVWAAWTQKELLDQWWAPKPYRVETKSMNFTEGGTWLYAMVSPENERHWAKADYKKIEPLKYYKAKDSFCDENGKVDKEFPGANWLVQFTSNNDETLLTIELTFDKLEALEQMIEMGFKEGFTAALTNLDHYFESTQ